MLLKKQTSPDEAPAQPTAIDQYRGTETAIGDLEREDADLEGKVNDAAIDPDGADERVVRAWRRRREEIVGERRRRVEELHRLAELVQTEIRERERQALEARISAIEAFTRTAQREMFESYSRLIGAWSRWRSGSLKLAELGPAAAAVRTRLGTEYDEGRAQVIRAASLAETQRWSAP